MATRKSGKKLAYNQGGDEWVEFPYHYLDTESQERKTEERNAAQQKKHEAFTYEWNDEDFSRKDVTYNGNKAYRDKMPPHQVLRTGYGNKINGGTKKTDGRANASGSNYDGGSSANRNPGRMGNGGAVSDYRARRKTINHPADRRTPGGVKTNAAGMSSNPTSMGYVGIGRSKIINKETGLTGRYNTGKSGEYSPDDFVKKIARKGAAEKAKTAAQRETTAKNKTVTPVTTAKQKTVTPATTAKQKTVTPATTAKQKTVTPRETAATRKKQTTVKRNPKR